MMETTEKKVIIIGAGLTGLTLAHNLRKAGVDVAVLEREDRTGGSIRTFRKDGFVYESGPNTGVLSRAEVAELFDDLAHLCKLEIADKESKRRLVFKGGRFHALPSGLMGAVTTPLFRFCDKIRILGEPFRKRGADPMESVAELVARRMGRSFLDYAVDPFIGGIYAGDPSKLVTRYALPKLWALEQEYGSFVKGAMQKARQPKSDRDRRATKEVMSAVGGMQGLTDALSESVGAENIVLGADNVTIIPPAGDSGWAVTAKVNGVERRWTARRVVSTVGSHALPGIAGFLGPELLSALDNMTYARVVQVALGFKHWPYEPLRAFGGLVPYKEGRPVLGALFMSSFMTRRAPEGGALISVFMGGVRHPEYIDMPDDKIIETAVTQLREMLHMPELSPDLVHVFRHPHAIPQYEASTGERLAAVEEAQKQHPGLIIAGNLRDGIGMADRIRQGRVIADGIISGEI